jgi:hypothetical protein
MFRLDQVNQLLNDFNSENDPQKKKKLGDKIKPALDQLEPVVRSQLHNAINDFNTAYNALDNALSPSEQVANAVANRNISNADPNEVDALMRENEDELRLKRADKKANQMGVDSTLSDEALAARLDRLNGPVPSDEELQERLNKLLPSNAHRTWQHSTIDEKLAELKARAQQSNIPPDEQFQKDMTAAEQIAEDFNELIQLSEHFESSLDKEPDEDLDEELDELNNEQVAEDDLRTEIANSPSSPKKQNESVISSTKIQIKADNLANKIETLYQETHSIIETKTKENRGRANALRNQASRNQLEGPTLFAQFASFCKKKFDGFRKSLNALFSSKSAKDNPDNLAKSKEVLSGLKKDEQKLQQELLRRKEDPNIKPERITLLEERIEKNQNKQQQLEETISLAEGRRFKR